MKNINGIGTAERSRQNVPTISPNMNQEAVMTRIHPKLLAAVFAAMIAAPTFAAEPVNPQATPTPAGGIRTDFGDVQIDNLGIGRTYNLRDLAGTPMKVTNTGADTINLVMSAEIPTDAMITPIRKELGYKPVPTIDWVTLGQTQFIVPSGESAYTDIIIKIPDDPSLYGKKFQADIFSRTSGAEFLNMGVWSHLQLTIAGSPEAQAAIEKNRKHGVLGNMEYTLLPDKLVIENVVIGKTLDIKKELKRTMMVANSGADSIELSLKPVPIGDTPLSLQTGYEEGNLDWLAIKSGRLKVEGSSFADPGFTLKIPNDKSLAGKKLMWVVKVAPASADVVGVTYYGKLYVEMAK